LVISSLRGTEVGKMRQSLPSAFQKCNARETVSATMVALPRLSKWSRQSCITKPEMVLRAAGAFARAARAIEESPTARPRMLRRECDMSCLPVVLPDLQAVSPRLRAGPTGRGTA
jgi:hypothetical protein